MSTHTDGATSPSVGGSDEGADGETAGAPAFAPGASPPRPRDPAAVRPAAPPRPAPQDPARPPARNGHPAGPRSGADAGQGDAGWVQQEIQRRIAERGAGESGRHSRSDRARTAPGDDGGGRPPPEDTPPPRGVGGVPRAPRKRSTDVPDPYAPGGMREQPAPAGPEGPFRMQGPAAGAPEPQAPVRAPPGAAAPATPPKEWPPADLPRRVPGAVWPPGRRSEADTAGGVEATDDDEPETRIVPALWSAAHRPSAAEPGAAAVDRRGSLLEEDLADDDDDEFDDDLDDDDLEDDLARTGETEVIWRAPGLDDAPVAAPPVVDGALPPNPYTGVRPRAFAAAPTDVEPAPQVIEDERPQCPDLDDAPQGKRKRVVLSERRNIAHSVRTVVDMQDPGPVGTMWRSQLVSTQLRISMQVGGVALLGLFLTPALFAAFPSIGEVSVLGIRLPWLALGFLTYPFLLLLGWWFVSSAERAEQDFMREVQDR